MRHERTIYYVLIGWLVAGDFLSDALLKLDFIITNPVATIFATVISLSNILGFITSALSSLMTGFWSLLPFL